MIDIVYFVACSVDGFIATPDGGVDWLSAVESAGEDYGYQAFFDGVDAMLIGSRTYEQVLGFGEWPYGDKRCVVFTRRRLEVVGPRVTLSDRGAEAVMAELEAEGVERAWMVGGSQLAGSWRDAGLLTEYLISVIPVVLGEGIPLLPAGGRRQQLTLVETRRFDSGVVNLHYRTAGQEG